MNHAHPRRRRAGLAACAAAAVLAALAAGAAADRPAFETLYNFGGGSDGANPVAGLEPDGEGSFYGVTSGGGARGFGTVFKFTPPATLITLYSFRGGSTDGATPSGRLRLGGDGRLYGVTSGGGSNGLGTIFAVTPNDAASTEEVLHSFAAGEGSQPASGLARDPSAPGGAFGVTPTAGAKGAGTVYAFDNTGASPRFSVLYAFGASPTDGRVPQGPLLNVGEAAKPSLLLGLTAAGGSNGYGTVFRLSPAANPLVPKVRTWSSYGYGTGETPTAGLTLAPNGLYYGTAGDAFGAGLGGIFQIDSSGGVFLRYVFNAMEGGKPLSGLLAASDGNLYGTTTTLGLTAAGKRGAGSIYRLRFGRPPTSYFGFEVLHVFNQASDGGMPLGLAEGPDGNLYGIARNGGGSNMGTLFRLDANLFTLPAPTGVKATPGWPGVRTVVVDNVTVQWIPLPPRAEIADHVKGYRIFARSSEGDAEPKLVAEAGSPASTVRVTGLVGGTPYFFSVQAIGTLGLSPRSAEATATPPASAPVIKLTPSSNPATVNVSASVSWQVSFPTARCTPSGSASTIGAQGIVDAWLASSFGPDQFGDFGGTLDFTPGGAGLAKLTLSCTGPGGSSERSLDLRIVP